MKYIWEPSDIKVGRRLRASSGSETFIIGYDATIISTDNLVLMSLSDGAISLSRQTYETMASELNSAKKCPLEIIDTPQKRSS